MSSSKGIQETMKSFTEISTHSRKSKLENSNYFSYSSFSLTRAFCIVWFDYDVEKECIKD